MIPNGRINRMEHSGEGRAPVKKKSNWIWIAVMAALLTWTLYSILRKQTPGQLARAIASADWRILVLGLPVMALFIAFEAKSTHWILRALGSPQPYRKCYFYSCTGFFFSTITPSATGGQPAQVYYMSRDGVPAASGTIDMLLTTIGYNGATLFYGLLALITGRGMTEQLGGRVGFLLGVGFMAVMTVIVTMLLFLFLPEPARRLCLFAIRLAVRIRPSLDQAALEKKLELHLEKYRQGAKLIRRTRGLFPKVLLMGAGQLACTYAVPCIVYRAFGLEGAAAWEIFSLQVLCTIAVSYLPLPGAAGAAESVFLRGFAAAFGAGLVAPAMILTRTVNCYLVLIVTGIVTAVGHFRGRRPLPASGAGEPEAKDTSEAA